jgi:hypothetical protein
VVRVTRLDQMLFSVQSFGRASIPNPQLQATRSVAALVRVAYPTINPQGAITANGDVDIQGASFEADGRDRIPYAGSGSAWNATRCAGLTGPTRRHRRAPGARGEGQAAETFPAR